MAAVVPRQMAVARVQARQMSGLPQFLYKNLWRKRMANYIAYVLAGCVVMEIVYGKATDYAWDSVNRGVRMIKPGLN